MEMNHILVVEDDKEIRLNQSTVESIGEAAASLAAVRELKEPDDLEDYALRSLLIRLA